MALKLIREQAELTEGEAAGREWLRNAPDAVITCHGQGHSFAKLRADNKSMPGIQAHRQHDGGWQIRQPCPNECGTTRTMTTMPGGWYDRDCHYGYEYEADYHPPKGSNLSPRDYFEETFRRMQPILEASGDVEG